MAKARVGTGLLAGCLLLWGGALTAKADPTVPQMLRLHPSQEGVVFAIPTAQEENSCKVERVNGERIGSGYVLRDPQGRLLRRFYNSKFTDPKDKTQMDVWSYYKDGVEVYREWAVKNGDRASQFRWVNSGGMKWGVDLNGDGKIDYWKMISPEEVSQELVQALVAKDVARLQALMIAEAEIKSLDLPAKEVARIHELQNQAGVKLLATAAKLGLTDKTHWMHLETASPLCLPAEQTGAKADLVKHMHGTVLVETAGKNDWLQTGEMIQTGMAWRLIDAPVPGLANNDL